MPTRRKEAAQGMTYHLDMLLEATVPGPQDSCVPLADKPFETITKADVEAVRSQRRARAQADARAAAALAALPEGTKPDRDLVRAAARHARACYGGEVGTNRVLARWRHLHNWAIAAGIAETTTFKRHGVTVVKLESTVENPRTCRLDGDEEARLFAAASPHLQALIIACLDMGCRKGELLNLQWRDVHGDTIILPASTTKTYQNRAIPISQRLAAILEMRRLDPKGKELPPTAYVFGDEVGGRIKSVKTAWTAAKRRAGIVGLQLGDLRREFGSQLLEADVAPHVVRDFLGHSNLTTTSRYLATSIRTQRQALKKLEQARACTSLAHEGKSEPRQDSPTEPDESAKLQEAGELGTGGPRGDRTHDPVIKSHVLYH